MPSLWPKAQTDTSGWAAPPAALVRINENTLAGWTWKTPEVYRILYDGGHRLWLATVAGLYFLDTPAYNQAPRLVEDPAFANPRSRFTDLALDDQHRLWAASDQGLLMFDGDRWQRIDPGAAGVNPYLIAADTQGNLWATGSFAGIARLRVAGGRVVESERFAPPRLPSESVNSMFVDHRGWLWVGQDTGLTVYDGHSWRSFTRDDGLIWNDLDSNGIHEDADGSMWIGTSGGLSHLLKPETVPPIAPPTPTISRIAFGAAPVADGSEISWSPSTLAITVTPLSFRDARHLRIRYRLLGLESEWEDTADEDVRYPRLNPGTYSFQAETVDVTGGAASAVKQIDFRIVPRWWQRWELRFGLALLGVVLLLLWLRWRLRALVRQKRHLELAVAHRTEDLQHEKTELLRTREQMRHYAEHDDLTGLWNHRIIIERLRGEADRAGRDGLPLSIVLVDLDHFKQVNDTFGHLSGDSALKQIAGVFLHSVRSYDWVGRYGGEEFLLILPGTSLTNAASRAEQLRCEVQAAHIPCPQGVVRLTASFGVASGIPSDAESLLHAADTALYRAKANGRNRVEAVEIGPSATPADPPMPPR